MRLSTIVWYNNYNAIPSGCMLYMTDMVTLLATTIYIYYLSEMSLSGIGLFYTLPLD